MGVGEGEEGEEGDVVINEMRFPLDRSAVSQGRQPERQWAEWIDAATAPQVGADEQSAASRFVEW